MYQAQVVTGGNEAFDAFLYQGSPSLNRDWFEQQFQRVSNVVGDHASQFMDAARGVYEQLNGSRAMMLARAALDQVKTLFNPNVIQSLLTIDEMRAASPIMQRWIMACPEVRSLYNEGRCAGFGETYYDNSPGTIGIDNYDYRRVTNGLIREVGEELVFTEFFEELLPGDRELTLREQCDILSTHEIAKIIIAAGKEDPTDVYGGNL